MLKLRTDQEKYLSLNQILHNGGIGTWSYNKNFRDNSIGSQFKMCNWNQTKMIIAEIESFTEVLCEDYTSKYYITFTNAIIINQCDISFGKSQCCRKYKD
jgi:hypothetical protein